MYVSEGSGAEDGLDVMGHKVLMFDKGEGCPNAQGGGGGRLWFLKCGPDVWWVLKSRRLL